MKYRVRVDLSFDSETDATNLMNYAKIMAGRAVTIKAEMPDKEVSFCDFELCGHDEGRPCQRIERVEVP